MKKKIYQKLARDRIPEKIEEAGSRCRTRQAADDAEFSRFLAKKLREEVQELIEDPSEEELADVYEVLEFFQGLHRLYGVKSAQISKRVTKGSFEERTILEWVEE